VVANGGGFLGWKLMGKRVAVAAIKGNGCYAEYCLAESTSCLELDKDIDMKHASCSFVNPLTVLAFLDVAKSHNVTTVIHSAAASSLGRMMIRHFRKNNMKIINVVRK